MATLAITSGLFVLAHCGQHSHDHADHEEHDEHDEHATIGASIIVDNKELGIRLTAHGAALYGFDHQPKSAKEKKQFKIAMAIFKSKPDKLFSLAPQRKCKFTTTQADGLQDGHHYVVNILIEVKCDKPLAPGTVEFHIGQFFPEVKSAKVERLGQLPQIISAQNGKIDL